MSCKDCNDDCNQGRKCPIPHDSKYLVPVLAVLMVSFIVVTCGVIFK